MARFVQKVSSKAGLPPGTLVHIGRKRAEKSQITIINYNDEDLYERTVHRVQEYVPVQDESSFTWMNIDSISDVQQVEEIGKMYDIHPLMLEDILNTSQRPKMEEYDGKIFIVAKMISYDEKKEQLDIEQVSFVLGSNFLITFQEEKGDVFDPVRERLRNDKSKMRKQGVDYLAYGLLDAIVDNYFIVLENVDSVYENIQELMVANPEPYVLQRIHQLKKEMIFLRKSAWPLREVIGGLERTESDLIKETTALYIRDLYDHVIQVIDTIETFQDMISGMLDIYLSSVSNKMNEIMKVLTVISTIFIPLTFIAGVYGMNFRYIPELEWKWGYFACWGAMIIVGLMMVFYFKRKKWL